MKPELVTVGRAEMYYDQQLFGLPYPYMQLAIKAVIDGSLSLPHHFILFPLLTLLTDAV